MAKPVQWSVRVRHLQRGWRCLTTPHAGDHVARWTEKDEAVAAARAAMASDRWVVEAEVFDIARPAACERVRELCSS